MAELWLPLEDRLATWDAAAERLRVTGWRPGPAGVSALELSAGLWVVVDHASPSTLTELSLDVIGGTVDDQQFGLLATLLGDEAADALRRLTRLATSMRPVPLRSRRRPRGDPEDEWSWSDDGSRREDFARMALAADLAGDAGVSPAARGVAAVEAALAASELGAPQVDRLAREAVEDLVELVDGLEDPKLRYRVSALARHLAEVLGTGPLSSQARSVAEDLARSQHRSALLAAAPAMPMTALPAMAALRLEERPERPVTVDGAHRAWAWMDAGENVRVKAGPSAVGTWARVFRAADRLLLGLAPLRPSGGDKGSLQSTIVIPPTTPADLIVDITDDPSTPRRAPSHEHHRRAILLGREAARFTRIGDSRADAAWERCALAWEVLGDAQRANLARRAGARDDRAPGRPSGRRRAGNPPRLMADEID